MGKSLKKLVVGLLLVGVVGLVVSKLTGGEAPTEESSGIDRVDTGESDAESDEAEDDVDLEVEVESDDEEFEADLDLPAASGGLDTFDYLAVLAAGAKAAYEEYRNRA